MKNMIFISDLKVAQHIRPEYAAAIDEVLPRWIEAMVPHYEEGKRLGVDAVRLANVSSPGSPHQLYESNGHRYHLRDGGTYGKVLSMDGTAPYAEVRFEEWLYRIHPELEADWGSNVMDRFGVRKYFSRFDIVRHPDQCSIIGTRVNDYFRSLTNDNTVGFALGDESWIYYNDQTKKWLDLFVGVDD